MSIFFLSKVARNKNLLKSVQRSNYKGVLIYSFKRKISSIIPAIQNILPNIQSTLCSSTPMIAFATSIPHGPSGLVCSFLNTIHGVGFGWWSSIIIGGAVIRLALLPLLIHSTIQSEKMACIKVEMDEINAKIKYAQQIRDTEFLKQSQNDFQSLMKRHSISMPSMLIAPLVQLPVLFVFFRGIMKLDQVFPDFKTSHFLWCNMANPDPIFILPALSGLFLYFTVNFASASQVQSGTMKLFMNFMSIFTAILCTRVSTGLCLYWITTSCIGVLQNLLLKSNALREHYHLDPLPLEKRFIYQLKSKYVVPPPPMSLPTTPILIKHESKENNDKEK